MSETTETATQGGGAPAPEPAAAPAPADDGVVDTSNTHTDTPADTPDDTTTEPEPEAARPSRADRRIAALSARLSAGEAERARLSSEVERLRRGAAPEQQQQVQIPQEYLPLIEQEVLARTNASVAQREAEQLQARFHEAGRAAHPDWAERCANLMAMGADAAMSRLLLEIPDGARVAGALADEPEELERIAALQTPTARAIALGQYAARVTERPAPPRRAAAVSRAPAPIRPVSGSVNAEPNPYAMNADQAVEYYSKMDMDSRRR